MASANRGISSIEDALEDLKRGKFVVVLDNEDRENEGDLIMPAEFATEESLAFMIRYCSGVICAPALPERIKELNLQMMTYDNTEVRQCKFTVSVDLKEGTSTGISARDRAKTIRAIADPEVGPSAFNRPGHVFPLVGERGGVISRAGHTEASIDLARLAGCKPVGFLCEINDDEGKMMRRPELEVFAKEHDLHLITISDLIRYRFTHELFVERAQAESEQVTTPEGTFTVHDYHSLIDDQHYETLVYGDVAQQSSVLVHFAQKGAKGVVDVQWAQRQIVAAGAGVIIYTNNAERLIQVSGELMAKQSIFGMGMQVVKDLGISSVSLLARFEPDFATTGFGIPVDNVTKLVTN